VVLARKDIQSGLEAKGFRLAPARDHEYLHLYVQGRKTHVFTKLSRGTRYRDYGDALLKRVKQQLRLANLGELRDLVRCPMSGKDYVRLLYQRGELRRRRG
jgi:hypothetical protein